MDRLFHEAYRAQRWLIFVIAIQIVIFSGLLYSKGLFGHIGMDYFTTYTAAEMIRDGAAADVYDTRAQWEYQRPIIEEYQIDWGDRVMHPYIAPPVLGVLSIPLLVLGPTLAYAVWLLLNIAAVAVGIWLLSKRLAGGLQAPLVVLVGSLPLFMILMLGQVEGLLFLAFVIFALELREGRDIRAGLALAAFAIKPPLLLAPLLYLAITGRRRATWTAILAVASQAVLSMALVGTKGIRDFIELSQRLSGPDGTTVTNVWGMVNIRSIVVRTMPADNHLLANAMIVGLTGVTLAVACWFWKRSGREATGLPCLALLSVTTVLTAYHALYHTTFIALLGVVLLVAHSLSQRDEARVERLTVFSWTMFSALPLLAFVVVQTSTVPAVIGVVGILLLWGVATGAVSQQIASTEAATRPSSATLQPWYVVVRK